MKFVIPELIEWRGWLLAAMCNGTENHYGVISVIDAEDPKAHVGDETLLPF